jgi:hypothetical protein
MSSIQFLSVPRRDDIWGLNCREFEAHISKDTIQIQTDSVPRVHFPL